MEAALGTWYDVTIEFENTACIKSRADCGGHKTMKSSHLFLHIELSGAAADGRTGYVFSSTLRVHSIFGSCK
jgi:hypothetical protein